MQKKKQPNILWICTDQQRYDTINALGYDYINTPNLNRLCSTGVAFSHAYCQNPICSPSRASFLTGLYPSSAGVNRNGAACFPRNDRVKLITKHLSESGYTCGLVGKLHLASAWTGEEQRTDDGYKFWCYSHSPNQGSPETNQYLKWLVDKGVGLDNVFTRNADGSLGYYKPDVEPHFHQTFWCIEKSIDFIREYGDEPWMLSVNIFDPHPPFEPVEQFSSRYDADKLPKPLFRESDLEQQQLLQKAYFQTSAKEPRQNVQEIKANYYGKIQFIDEQVGLLFEALETNGQLENTVVIYTSDHGEALGDHGLLAKGCRFYEGLVRVPLIMSWPGHFQKNLICDDLVELTDITPTIAELAGIDLVRTHGNSLLPVLNGDSENIVKREFVRAEYYDTLNMSAPEHPQKHRPCLATMYRDSRYKICIYHNIDAGELYDLEQDPGEYINLWDDTSMVDIRNELIMKSFNSTVLTSDYKQELIGRY